MEGHRRDHQKLDIISAVVTLLSPASVIHWTAQTEDTSTEDVVYSRTGSGYWALQKNLAENNE